VAALCQGVTAIWLGQVTPFAFDAIHWRYYAVFISCLVVLAAFYAVCLTETNGLTLERIAGEFGDEVVQTDKLGEIKRGEELPELRHAEQPERNV
jgi:hypothetical protein